MPVKERRGVIGSPVRFYDGASETVTDTGVVLESDEPKRLVYTFRQEGFTEHCTRVAFDLEPIEGGVRLRLVHDELADPGGVEGWTPILNNLKQFLAS